MKKTMGICGLVCTECGAYQATKNDDDAKREEVAKLWSKEFKSDIKPEDINCTGCFSVGDDVFGYSKTCEIRKCGKEREVENCAFCDDYACEKLIKFFEMAPVAKDKLEEIRNK